MLLNITYNFGNHRTVTKRLDYLGHIDYILRLSTDELKAANLLFYHEPNADELFAMQNLKGFVLDIGRRKWNEKVAAENENEKVRQQNDEANSIFPRIGLPGIGKSDWQNMSSAEKEKNSTPIRILFLDEEQMNARYSREKPESNLEENDCDCCIEFDDSEDNDDSGGECMCDWEYRTRCTCGFEESMNSNPNAGVDNSEGNCPDFVWCRDCGNEEFDCECPDLLPEPKPYEANTNLLANADYFRKRAREKNLEDINNVFSDLVERGDTHIEWGVWPWMIPLLREKGYDFEECEIQSAESIRLGQIDIHIFLTGRNN